MTYFPGILSNGALVAGLAAETVRTTLGLGTADSPTFAGGTFNGTCSATILRTPDIELFSHSVNASFLRYFGTATRIGLTILIGKGIVVSSNLPFSFSSGLDPNTAVSDVFLYRGGPGILQQRNATNGQISEVYKTYTSATSNERLALDTTAAGFLDIVAARGSLGGAENGIRIGGKLDGGSIVPWLSFATSGAATLTIASSGVALKTTATSGYSIIDVGGSGINGGYLRLLKGPSPAWAFTNFSIADVLSVYSYVLGSDVLRLTNTGGVGVGLTPTAALHIKAGTATAGTAPIKLTTGVSLTTPEAGAIEYDGTNLYFTDSGGTRRTLAVV